MPLYSFYPTNWDGPADTCATQALEDEAHVAAYATALLEARPNAMSIVVWRGARCVLIQSRARRRQAQASAAAGG